MLHLQLKTKSFLIVKFHTVLMKFTVHYILLDLNTVWAVEGRCYNNMIERVRD